MENIMIGFSNVFQLSNPLYLHRRSVGRRSVRCTAGIFRNDGGGDALYRLLMLWSRVLHFFF